jgi:hypothetical protein
MKILKRLKKAITSARTELVADLFSKMGLGFILAAAFGKAEGVISEAYSFAIGIVLLVLALIIVRDKEEK